MRFWTFSLRTKMYSTILIKYEKTCWSLITVVSLNFLVFNLLLARITLTNTIFNNLGLWKLSVFLPKSNGGQTTWFSFEIVFGVCYSNNAFVRTQWFKKLLVEICHFNTKNRIMIRKVLACVRVELWTLVTEATLQMHSVMGCVRLIIMLLWINTAY